jgi:hypothetical protein
LPQKEQDRNNKYRDEVAKEQQQVQALQTKITGVNRLATQKFILKVDLIFKSMDDYYISSLGSRYGGGVLRKDVDRYNDAIVEAKGVVPDAVITYVEGAYLALRTRFGSTNWDHHLSSMAKGSAMKKLAE